MEHLNELLILDNSQSSYGILSGEFKPYCIIRYGIICLQPESTEEERASFCVHAQEWLSIFLAAGLHKGSRMSSSVIVHCGNCNTFISGLRSENLFPFFEGENTART